MDYKKNYENALEVARELMEQHKQVVCAIFPELKEEKEGEDIKKELIDLVQAAWDDDVEDFSYDKKIAWINWLKKQGKEKTNTDFSDLRTWEYIVDAVLTEKEGIGQYLDSPVTEEIAKKLQERFGNIKQESIPESSTKLVGIYPEDLEKLWKSKNEEKSSHTEIEPRFKVKDWIVSVDGKVLQVTGIEGDSYVFNDRRDHCYYWTIQDCDKECHPWSFKDAKDGDIITCECGWTCIFKALIDDETFSSYCFMDATRHVFETGDKECHTLRRDGGIRTYNGKFYPATWMQEAGFLDEIRGAGYTWNSKKKKLTY